MPDSLVAKLNFDAREKDKDKDSRPKSGSTSRVNSPPISRSNSVIAVNKPRFKLTETSHEHNLKSAKRQEKLTNMLKDLLGAKKLRNEAKSAVPNILGEHFPAQGANQPPTLFAGLVNQIKHSDETASASDASIDRSFAEKYGRCQEVIGKGAFGTVRISHKRVGDAEGEEALYAVKEFRRKPNESEKKFNRRLTSEFCISSSLKNINIIDTLDLLKDAKGDYVEVMEFCSGGDLYTLIIASGKLEYAEADCFFKQLIKGVNYMHDMGVSHRDLKPENLLLTPNGILKITDFGNSECFKMAWEQEVQLSEGICGSSPYIAPEEFTTNHFDSRCVDIWSCGVIYMAMRTGRQLWSVADPEKDEFFREYLVKRRNSTGYEPIENLKRARCRNVIYSILDPKPSRRITGKQILNSEWGREIKLCPAAKGELEVLTSPVGGNIPTVAE
ncbi:Pkinase-domain-containing protein [Yamadazyma tenuis ATCC 10573]|uniref:non-specific serine/threonine protein kinase n=2 Tax=Candida tenuis TaxID=2315449 RepID=G3AWP6_CANTC|nr:Pkinase-domain-containing protein [Yamadazyma tenuis ATCC 10573]EGV66586.1 Pkinase-domain-containing protein [Yamadazyma tenuis ATCC 10573]